MPSRQVKTFCRTCMAGCGAIMEIGEDDKIAAIRPDADDPLSSGYFCFKGLKSKEAHHGPNRLLHPLKRQPDGSYQRIGLEQALDEIAAKLGEIIKQDGVDAVATFLGNSAHHNSTTPAMVKSFAASLGTTQYFSTITIDQSAKFVTFGRMGMWMAGNYDLDRSDVALLIGINPLVSLGPPLMNDPLKRLKQARARGFKLIVIDPRRNETARHADLFLQPYPGQDAAIIGGLLRMILAEGWQDKEFCDRYVGADRMAALRDAVEPLLPDYVEARAGLKPGQLREVATLFGRDSRTGSCYAGTGTDMAPYSNLAQHLADCLNVICGRFRRAGDPVYNRNVQVPRMPVLAQVMPAMRFWEGEGMSRIRGVYSMFGERPSGTLSDEILTPGKGKIRALLVDAGDPATSLPDQHKAVAALQSLDLLVSIDPWPTPTTQLAHYVLPPVLAYERADLPFNIPMFVLTPGAWGRYAAPIIPPPAGSELVDDWYVFWSIAKRLGVTINFGGTGPFSAKQELDMVNTPTKDDLLNILLTGTEVSLDELKRYPEGHDFGMQDETVLPGDPDSDARFDVMPTDVAAELRSFMASPDQPGQFVRDGKTFSHLLTSSRHRDFMNSNGAHIPAIRERHPYNPVCLNPEDLDELGLVPGQYIEISSPHGATIAIADVDPNLRRGVVTLMQGWGGLPSDTQQPERDGTCVNLLIDTDRNFESINAMPHMSGVPINIRARPGDSLFDQKVERKTTAIQLG